MTTSDKPNLCVCGDEEEYHVDNEGQCFIADCGCKGFEPAELAE